VIDAMWKQLMTINMFTTTEIICWGAKRYNERILESERPVHKKAVFENAQGTRSQTTPNAIV
jgi:hypothetical protein